MRNKAWLSATSCVCGAQSDLVYKGIDLDLRVIHVSVRFCCAGARRNQALL